MDRPDVERAVESKRADEHREPENGQPGSGLPGNGQPESGLAENGEAGVEGWFQSIQPRSWFQPKAAEQPDNGDAPVSGELPASNPAAPASNNLAPPAGTRAPSPGNPAPHAGNPAPHAGNPAPHAGNPGQPAGPRAPSTPAPGASNPAPPAGKPAPSTPAPGTGKPASKKSSRSVFGEVDSSRPDVLTDAETVVMAIMDKQAGGQRRVPTFVPVASPPDAANTPAPPVAAGPSSAALADAPTQLMSALRLDDRPVKTLSPAPSSQKPRGPLVRYTASLRQTWVSRGLLLGVLVLQAILSLHLRNTAFEDEALYLYAGHIELAHLLHHTALHGNFAASLSGAPVLYPVLAAALDNVGGLALVRALSLVEMLSITAMVYSIGRYLFNERAGLCAAGLFSVTESALFLGNFATYDATCLFLLASAAWIMVYTARSKWPLFLLAIPVAALAVAVKYAGLLWIPTVAILPPLVAWPDRLRRVWLYPLVFLAGVGGLLSAGLRLGGHTYVTVIQNTITDRAQGTTPVGTLLRDSLSWGGVVFALAVVGSVAYIWKVRTEDDEQIAPAAGLLGRAALGLVLTVTALLAPAYQAYLHTDISFQKHIGFGLFFAAPMAGFGLARLMGDYFRRPHIGVGLWSLALVLAMVQSNRLYQAWPSSTAFISAFATHLKPNAKYLVEAPEVPEYYLENRSDALPDQFTSTYSVPPLNGPANFTAAVKAGQFQVICFDGDVTPANDAALGKALAADHSYYLANKIFIGPSYGAGDYYEIWVKGSPPKSAKTAKPPTTKAGKTPKA